MGDALAVAAGRIFRRSGLPGADAPHQYATGVRDVFVNGVPVLRDGEHTGATPGRFVRGPGYTTQENDQ